MGKAEKLRRDHKQVDKLLTEISRARIAAEDAVWAIEKREQERHARLTSGQNR